MTEVGVREAAMHLSRLLRRVAGGEEITITCGGLPVARLVAFDVQPPRRFGLDRGRLVVPDDFDDPLPDDVLIRADR